MKWIFYIYIFLRVWVWHLNYYNMLHQFNFFIFSNYIHLIFIFIPLSIYLFIYSLIYSFFNSMNWHLGFYGYVIWSSILFYFISNYMISYFNFIFNFAGDLEPSRRGNHDQIGNLMKRISSVDDHLTMIEASHVFYRIPITFTRCPKSVITCPQKTGWLPHILDDSHVKKQGITCISHHKVTTRMISHKKNNGGVTTGHFS